MLLLATVLLLLLLLLAAALTIWYKKSQDVGRDEHTSVEYTSVEDTSVEDTSVEDTSVDFSFLRAAFTVTPEEAQRFSNFTYRMDHPDKCSGQDVHLLIFVKSATGRAERRRAIRSTWGNEAYIQRRTGVTVKVLFALGAPSAPEDQEDLEREDRLHGDLIQQDFSDTFRNLTLKVLMQFRWARQRCANARFVMTADDDTVVHTPNLVDYLQDAAQRNATGLWVGYVNKGVTNVPTRDTASKYYLPIETYPWSRFPPYTYGSGYVVSRDVVEKIYQASLTLNASIHIDDLVMGVCAYLIGITPQHHVFFQGAKKVPYHDCMYDHMFNSHGHHGQDMYDFWKEVS